MHKLDRTGSPPPPAGKGSKIASQILFLSVPSAETEGLSNKKGLKIAVLQRGPPHRQSTTATLRFLARAVLAPPTVPSAPERLGGSGSPPAALLAFQMVLASPAGRARGLSRPAQPLRTAGLPLPKPSQTSVPLRCS